jgi:hypothetical protein
MTADWYATKKSLEQDLEAVNQMIEDGRQQDAIPKPAPFLDRSRGVPRQRLDMKRAWPKGIFRCVFHALR